MYYLNNNREPLLPAHRRRGHHKRSQQSSTNSQRRKHGTLVLFLLVIILSFTTCWTVYILLPSPTTTTHTEEDSPLNHPVVDSEQELFALHHQPSPHFCSLQRTPLICAHGGDIEAAPPNTVDSFQAALFGGNADCIEIDVSMTKCGRLVALHDRDLSTLLNQPHNMLLMQSSSFPHSSSSADSTRKSLLFRRPWRLKSSSSSLGDLPSYASGDFTWEQIKQLQWKPLGSKIISLHQALTAAAAAPRDVSITLDVKVREGVDEEREAQVMAQAVVDALHASGYYESHRMDKILIWSKSDAVAAAVKSIDEGLRVGLVVVNDTVAVRASGKDDAFRQSSIGAEVAGVHYGMASRSLAHQLHSANKEFHVWTVNTATMMQQALDAGPDAVVTSYPRRVAIALEARARACEQQQQHDLKQRKNS